MRRFALVFALVAASSPALADSMKQNCNVEILRAPDEVRAAIEAWLANEQACSVSLAVRAVKTDGGYYLLAHAPDGRIFETVAVDAELAAEAITRWATNRASALAPRVSPPAPKPVEPEPAFAPLPAPTPAPTTPASAAPLALDRQVDGGVRMPRRDDSRWLTAGGIVGEELYGLRAEVDLYTKRSWALGAALELSSMQMSSDDTLQAFYTLGFDDIRAVMTGSRTWGTDRIQVRAGVAIGLLRSHVTGVTSTTGAIDASDIFATGDAGLQVVAHVHDRWALALGPQLTVYASEFRRVATEMTLVRRDYAVSAFAALRRRM